MRWFWKKESELILQVMITTNTYEHKKRWLGGQWPNKVFI